MVLSFAKCGVFCIFSLAPGMQMEADWICRHRHSSNTHPEQGIRAGWVLTSKPCVKFSPCMTCHSSVVITMGKFGPLSLGFFFLRNQSIKCSTKSYHGVSMVGESPWGSRGLVGRQCVLPFLWMTTTICSSFLQSF